MVSELGSIGMSLVTRIGQINLGRKIARRLHSRDARDSNGTNKMETPATVGMPGTAMAPSKTGTPATVGMLGTATEPATTGLQHQLGLQQ